MPGFPTRLPRRVFGPKFRNVRPVENPETECGAETLEPLLWQVAGANLVVPRASLVANYTGSHFLITHQAEAWNANGEQAAPALARTGAGAYTYTFAEAYLDNEGVEVAPNIAAARVSCLKALDGFADRIEAHAWKDPDSPLVVHVRLWDASGDGVDEPFWLEVL